VADAALADSVASLDIKAVTTTTLMSDPHNARRLAEAVLA
jgi:hypothetical protein